MIIVFNTMMAYNIKVRLLFLGIIAMVGHLGMYAQQLSYNFHKIGLESGLHDGIIRCIGQDRYGYIWVGSVGGVGKYDGKNFIKYHHVIGDSLSPLNTQTRSLLSDVTGRMWVGFENGLMSYDFDHNNFRVVKYFKGMFVSSLSDLSETEIAVGTYKGIYIYDVKQNKVSNFLGMDDEANHLLKMARYYALFKVGNTIYCSTSSGLIKIDLVTRKASIVKNKTLSGSSILSIAKDSKDRLWICSNGELKLLRWTPETDEVEVLDYILDIGNEEQPYYTVGVISDHKNRIWIATSQDGLLEYDIIKQNFRRHKHHPMLPSSPSGNAYRCIFEDKSGLIWLGLDVEGINYFDPNNALFSVILPFPNTTNQSFNQVGRAVTTDLSGNFWFGNHDGVTKYNPKTEQYQIFRNETDRSKTLYSNHVRTMFCDKENNIWIGTASGVNKYIQKSDEMTFVDPKNLPQSFYNSINADKSGKIWFCTNDTATLYFYDLKSKKFGNIADHAVLKRFKRYTPVSYLTEDSKGRLWISFSRKCVVSYDKNTDQLKYYSATDTSKNKIVSNLVVDIKEDTKGMMWLSSFQGISGIDPEKGVIYNFTSQNGLPGNMSGPLCLDEDDRIWAGINGGLTMIDRDRKKIHYFKQNDGLGSAGFPEHAGVVTQEKNFLFPSNVGYIYFDPKKYVKPENVFPYYITSASIMDKAKVDFYGFDVASKLHLSHDENAFKIQFVSLYFTGQERNRFAYFLEGFDQKWTVTADPFATYTNIPSGNYTLKMVAFDVNDDYTTLKPKTLSIHIATVFYKTTLFMGLMALMLALGIYGVYHYRVRQQRRYFDLQSKTQLLEKEKATAMFENLKQQLNPHFLFNSLSSLSGLIELDKNVAATFLNQLSVIYRYILKNAENELVHFKDEIHFVSMYVELQKTRFGEALVVNMQVPSTYFEDNIAPVTLQNMIENAIKHNIIHRNKPLIIDIYVDENRYLVIKNNLQLKTVVETSNKKGLSQFISLYKYLTPKPVIIDNKNTSHFIIKIPLL